MDAKLYGKKTSSVQFIYLPNRIIFLKTQYSKTSVIQIFRWCLVLMCISKTLTPIHMAQQKTKIY